MFISQRTRKQIKQAKFLHFLVITFETDDKSYNFTNANIEEQLISNKNIFNNNKNSVNAAKDSVKLDKFNLTSIESTSI